MALSHKPPWGSRTRLCTSPLVLSHYGRPHPSLQFLQLGLSLGLKRPSSLQGAPARERPCSCSSVPASSASSRPLSEPSKQPESRGMSTLGSDTVCATGSWLLSAPSSASSLPAAGKEEAMKGPSLKWDGGEARGGISGCLQKLLGLGHGLGTLGKSLVGGSAFLTPPTTSASLFPTSSILGG